ncbi:YeiH family protein [Deferribacter abyssi]|uniref:YeiH family protein n=1 Tax=Deferribacter abyssi TaxID=213806 RepID=UPI003C1F1A90
MKKSNVKLIFITCFFLTAIPVFSSAYALILGLTLSLIFGNPFPKQTAQYSKQLLKLSVIGLGFGVNFYEVIKTGKNSIILTFLTITTTILIGYFLGKILNVEKKTSILISFGTAICGGSAIAAMAPTIDADNKSIAVSLATVFTLNAIALLIFPPIGHFLNLNEQQFGLFSALAIHDTSSVVGAAATYGSVALAIATTVKLTRALWIAPFSMAAGFITGKKKKTSFPLFILGFIAAAFINTLFNNLNTIWHSIAISSKQLLVMTLFLIGTGLSKEVLREVGIKPLIQGITLWIIVSFSTLGLIYTGLLKQ